MATLCNINFNAKPVGSNYEISFRDKTNIELTSDQYKDFVKLSQAFAKDFSQNSAAALKGQTKLFANSSKNLLNERAEKFANYIDSVAKINARLAATMLKESIGASVTKLADEAKEARNA